MLNLIEVMVSISTMEFCVFIFYFDSNGCLIYFLWYLLFECYLQEKQKQFIALLKYFFEVLHFTKLSVSVKIVVLVEYKDAG